jgi:hypothetical protein
LRPLVAVIQQTFYRQNLPGLKPRYLRENPEEIGHHAGRSGGHSQELRVTGAHAGSICVANSTVRVVRLSDNCQPNSDEQRDRRSSLGAAQSGSTGVRSSYEFLSFQVFRR